MRRKKQESGIEYDEKLLQHIAPIGNMTPYNSYCRTGTGYEACVHIFSLPTMLDDFWMTDICNFQNSVATISIVIGLSAYAQQELGCSVITENFASISLRGQYDPTANAIRLNDRLEDTQKLSTLAHELGHAVLLHQIGDEKSEHQKELEADALGIMLESYFGIEPTDSRRRHLAKHYRAYEKEWEEVQHKDSFGQVIKNVFSIFREEIPIIAEFVEQQLSEKLVLKPVPIQEKKTLVETEREDIYTKIKQDIQILDYAAIHLIVKSKYKNIDIIKGSVKLKEADADNELALKKALSYVEDRYDICVIDTRPAIESITRSALYAADLVVTPVLLDNFCRDNLLLLEDGLQEIEQEFQWKIFANKVENKRSQRNIYSDMVQKHDWDFWDTCISKRAAVENALALYKPLLKHKKKNDVTNDYMDLAKELLEV